VQDLSVRKRTLTTHGTFHSRQLHCVQFPGASNIFRRLHLCEVQVISLWKSSYVSCRTDGEEEGKYSCRLHVIAKLSITALISHPLIKVQLQYE
jgi:hypothetical protein